MSNENSSYGGISAGCIIAAILSWMVNHDILWAIVHGLLGWLYVIYWAIYHWH